MTSLNFGPLSPYTGIPFASIAPTLARLRLCIQARQDGYPVSYTTDPGWLVNQAINRRACWPEDPSCSRGTCPPVAGRYPKRAIGDHYMRTWRFAHAINSRALVSEREARQVLGVRRADKLADRLA